MYRSVMYAKWRDYYYGRVRLGSGPHLHPAYCALVSRSGGHQQQISPRIEQTYVWTCKVEVGEVGHVRAAKPLMVYSTPPS